MFASVDPTSEPINDPTSSVNVGRPDSRPSDLAKALFPVPGTPQQQNAPGAFERIAAAGLEQGPLAERLKRVQAAQATEVFAAPMQGQQTAFLQHARFQVPDRFGCHAAVTDQRQADRGFRLIPGQPSSGVQYGVQLRTLRQFTVFHGNATGDLL